MGQALFEPPALTELIGHVYEAAAEPAHWDAFVGALERHYPGQRITFFGHAQNQSLPSMRYSRNYGANDLQAYLAHFYNCSPYIVRCRTLPVGRAADYTRLIRDAELMETEFYNDYIRARRLGHYATGVLIDYEPTTLRGTALSLTDHKDNPERRREQMRLIDLLAPHLARSIRLGRIMTAERQRSEAAQAALDHWSHAAFVLQADGQVVYMNRLAEALLRRADGLTISREGQLRGADDAVTRRLGAAVRRIATAAGAIAAEDREPGDGGVLLPRPSGAASLRSMIAPLPFLGGHLAFGAGVVLMLIFEADRTRRAPVAWMGDTFGLTPAEQRLAEAVINGEPLAVAAERLAIRLTTARTRLKTILTKTHCHRQADLVRLAFSAPAIRAD
jgi:DNA-binding CsgD family transcriptional regulator